MALTQQVMEAVLPFVPTCQWVLSLPHSLRYTRLRSDAVHRGASCEGRARRRGAVFDLVFRRHGPAGANPLEDRYNTGSMSAAPMMMCVRNGRARVSGQFSGQFPGNPPNAGKTFAALYTNGARSFIRQEPLAGIQGAALDLSGNSYELYNDGGEYIPGRNRWTLRKLDSAGALAYRNDTLLTLPADYSWTEGVDVDTFHASDDGQRVIFFARLGGAAGLLDGYIASFDGSGVLRWAKLLKVEHEAVIDAIEGTKWQGVGRPTKVAVSSDAIYLTGSYSNSFSLGSNRPPNYTSTFVTKLDMEGNVLWTKLYRLNPLPVEPGRSGSAAASSPAGIRAMADGDIVLDVSHPSPSRPDEIERRAVRIAPDGTPR